MVYVARYTLVALSTIFWGTLALPLFLLDRSGWSFLFVARHWIDWCLRVCGVRVDVEGLENLTTPCVIMSNHHSVCDIAALIHVLPIEWRFVAKKELLWIPFFGWALALADQIIIDRGNRQKSVKSLTRAAERVRAGTNVIIFPEGTRSETTQLRDFKSGGFHLAIQAGVPVIPIAVSGSRHITPKHSLRIEPGRVLVRIGRPIPTKDLDIERRGELKTVVREAILDGFDPELQGGSAS